MSELYQFVPIESDTKEKLKEYRGELVDVDESDPNEFAQPPYSERDNSWDMKKIKLIPHDPHRSPEYKFDKTTRRLIELAHSHPDTDI